MRCGTRVRIDVRARTPGLRFEEAWLRRERMTYEGQVFHVVSKADLIACGAGFAHHGPGRAHG